MAQHISLFLAFGLEVAALTAAGAKYAPAVSSRINLYPTWLPPHGKVPGVPTVSLFMPDWMSQMPPSVNMDIKVAFEMYDMTPGATGKKFIRNLLIHGGKADARGITYADCLLRIDEGAVVLYCSLCHVVIYFLCDGMLGPHLWPQHTRLCAG